MTAIWYLLVLAPFVAIPILWWNYRRKIAARDRISDARWHKLVSTATAEPAAALAAGPATAAATRRTGFAQRGRVLDPAQTVLYYLLKNSLPDHEVLSCVALAVVLEVPAGIAGSEREQRLRNLTQHTVDFVVCNKSMQVVAVIDLPVLDPAAPTSAHDFKKQACSDAGIRYLRLSRQALPKRDTVRALVLGA